MPFIAALLACSVIGITDGDTLSVRCDADPHPVNLKVRLAEIDAPERAQPFGARSKKSLSDLCYRQVAHVVPVSRDRYGRTVARVRCSGLDAGSEQVRLGMAWVFVRYAKKGSPLYDLEREARAAHRGLWADAHAIAPWARRRLKGARAVGFRRERRPSPSH